MGYFINVKEVKFTTSSKNVSKAFSKLKCSRFLSKDLEENVKSSRNTESLSDTPEIEHLSELLEGCISYISVGRSLSEIIGILKEIGFSNEDLVEFGFDI